jgi:hypothetical protein
MSDTEFRAEIRRHLIAIIRACILRYGWTWADFMPHEIKADNKPLVVRQ